jgi:regulator of protease activity HflC (stomatin/prohibitin superfamily)
MYLILFLVGLSLYIFLRVVITGFYTVPPDERAVISSFGRAHRIENVNNDTSSNDETARYNYPKLKIKNPGGPYLKLPWQKVHRVRAATETIDLCWDPSKKQASVEAVTKDNLTTGVNGQIRFKISTNNLYPFIFGVQSPLEHVMGFFISVMRERIANFVDPKGERLMLGNIAETGEAFEGISINDLRKNLSLLNRFMEEQCQCTKNRYGIELDAALITEIDPPPEVDHALSAINSTRNQVAADISTARADAEQQMTMSKRAVEISMNNAEAEVAPLRELATTLKQIKAEGGSQALRYYIRTIKIPLLSRTQKYIGYHNKG